MLSPSDFYSEWQIFSETGPSTNYMYLSTIDLYSSKHLENIINVINLQ